MTLTAQQQPRRNKANKMNTTRTTAPGSKARTTSKTTAAERKARNARNCKAIIAANEKLAADKRARRTARDAKLAAIAEKHCGFETLETRNSDSDDFRDVAVWSLKDALEAAYAAGAASK